MGSLPRWAYLLFGGVVGLVVGAIVAVNVVIFAGVDGGYEASPAEVFEDSPVLGLLVIAILAGGPVVGGILAERSWRAGKGR